MTLLSAAISAGSAFIGACVALTPVPENGSLRRIGRVDTFLQQIVNGLTLGCVYAVVALGYTMVYGIIQLINFAHGEVVMIGAMVAFSVITALAGTALPPVLIVLAGILVAIPVCMLVGYAMERVAYRPLRGAPRNGR